MTRIETLLRAARRAGLGLTLDRRTRSFRATFLPGADAEGGRRALYPLLAALEDEFLVSVHGMPACLMPDAFEHFSWPLRARAPFRRIGACARCALRGRCPGAGEERRAAPGFHALLAPVLPAPAELVLELNKRCNLSCRACFGRSGEELPFRSAEKALRDAAAAGVKSVRFTGGEPLLCPDLERLLRSARRLGFYTLLNTNGVLFTSAAARRLAGLIDNALVSLPGIDEAGHAAASGGRGLFDVKTDALRRLRAAVRIVRAGTVVSRPLVRDFARWHAAVRALRFDVWELYRPMMTRASLSAAPEYRISLRDFTVLADEVAAQAPGGTRAVLANPVPFCSLPAAARPFALGARFDDGWTRLVLDASGRYKPSYPSRRFLGRALAAAWRHPFIRRTRGAAWLPEKCRGCGMFSICLGGSRFHAEADGDVFGPDPWMRG